MVPEQLLGTICKGNKDAYFVLQIKGIKILQLFVCFDSACVCVCVCVCECLFVCVCVCFHNH